MTIIANANDRSSGVSPTTSTTGSTASEAFVRSPVHILSGALFPTLIESLVRHGGCAPRFAGSVALTAAISLIRSPFYLFESMRVAKRVAAVKFDTPPVIILGHWRSGTTYLHNLMSRDPRFCFPSIVDAVQPHEFCPGVVSDMTRNMIVRNLPAARQVDDVPLRPDLPQEDEVALAALGAPSFFNCLYFPRRYGEIFRREVLFEGLSARDKQRWRNALTHYLGKIVALNGNKQLLLKNPAHTAHAAELRELFPNAKFIHIHRDPFEVFTSMRRMLHVTFSIVALQDYHPAAIDEAILAHYPLVMDRLDRDLAGVGMHADVRYADLVRQPVDTLARVYRELDLDAFDRVRPAFEAFAAKHVTTPRSRRPVDPTLMATIDERWRQQIVRLGYAS